MKMNNKEYYRTINVKLIKKDNPKEVHTFSCLNVLNDGGRYLKFFYVDGYKNLSRESKRGNKPRDIKTDWSPDIPGIMVSRWDIRMELGYCERVL